ncbi:M14 family metallocarboxypeptidase [Heyndrickxia sporothermodurans]|uniref:M14 family metallopeptidase n=1 Tax=Heyndrickxia sporothermodurans TaxID=46224 RepID=UPI001F3CFF3F|nr:M14 family metallocarboxypeptidase [Heyndrickxia sporothermodurans]
MKKRVASLLFIFCILFFCCMCMPSSLSSVHAASKDIVNPNQTYTYNKMVRDIKKLAKKYPSIIHYRTIGKSEYGKPIYAISLGTGKSTVFINGSHHAREWLTTNLNMYMLDQYAQYYLSNKKINGYDVKKILSQTTIWFVPMVNPDGVTLQQSGLKAFPKKDHAKLIKMNEGSKNSKRWKANGKGVDLNRQYDADWKHIKSNPGKPSWSLYKGKAPVTAKETKAIVAFVKKINPEMTVAYHTAGKILYWNFHQSKALYKRDLAYAKAIGKLTKYKLIYPEKNPSGGGLTDWFISKYKRPGFTLEIGTYPGNTNLKVSQFKQSWKENKFVGLYVAKHGYSLFKKH